MKTLARLVRLWRLYTYLDFMLMTRSLKLFVTFLITDTIFNIAAVTATLLLAERFNGIGAWSKFQIVFVVGYATLVGGLLDMFFTYNILFISRRLGRGQLDHVLIQPQSIWIAFFTEGFNPFTASGSVLVGSGLMIWAGMKLQISVSFLWGVSLILNVLSSMAVVLSFAFLWGSLAFWAPRAAEEITTPLIRIFSNLKSFPFDGLGPLLLAGVTVIVPVAFMAWYPSRYLLGLGASITGATITPLAALVISVFAVLVFRKGLEHYGRTGSQRYDDLGHRS
ncbi:ABC-2 family transporter protein [Candidatus Acetothermia bacterium]|nr:ABC-2 family transporter protein [Candidatus Acetothermia bacterium]